MIRDTLAKAYSSALEQETSSSTKKDEGIGEINSLTLVYFPDGILKQTCLPVVEVTEEIKQLARDMLLTMMLEGGIGLAAPQVGKLLRIFVVDIRWPEDLEKSDPHVFINPEIELGEGVDLVRSREACLSFPGGQAVLERHSSVKVRHLDGEGFPAVTEADGFFARVIQHEMDHLDGKTIQGSISAIDMRLVRKNIQEKLRRRKRETKAHQPHQRTARKRF
jgi:peptide deformylase